MQDRGGWRLQADSCLSLGLGKESTPVKVRKILRFQLQFPGVNVCNSLNVKLTAAEKQHQSSIHGLQLRARCWMFLINK